MTLDVVRLAPIEESPLPAGGFRRWLAAMSGALRSDGSSDVPCGDCTACCEGSYFIHLRSSDGGALARIPAALLFPAPGAGPGDRLMGYDGQGRCPMLRGGACAIYEDRPITCRTYDCRIFAATGLAEPGPEKARIMIRAGRWRFDYEDEAERRLHEDLRAAAWALVRAREALSDVLPGTATQLAMLVVRLHEELLAGNAVMGDERWLRKFREAAARL
ncbi:MAG TPA: YkgJ family cysteine cluster protein [Pseudomonadales bacterium]